VQRDPADLSQSHQVLLAPRRQDPGILPRTLRRPVAAFCTVLWPRPARSPLENQLRERWLLAIAELGRDAAFDDAVNAFVLRIGCSALEARPLVRRAWRTLALD